MGRGLDYRAVMGYCAISDIARQPYSIIIKDASLAQNIGAKMNKITPIKDQIKDQNIHAYILHLEEECEHWKLKCIELERRLDDLEAGK